MFLNNINISKIKMSQLIKKFWRKVNKKRIFIKLKLKNHKNKLITKQKHPKQLKLLKLKIKMYKIITKKNKNFN